MTGGVGKALDEVMGDLPEAGEFVQAALFDDLDETETGAMDAPSPLSELMTPRKRGPGRPRGSKNRRTEAVVGFLLSQGRHPLLVMMEAYSRSPAELLALIGIMEPDPDQLMEAFKLQMRMAEAVAPYVAQRLPQAVQIDAQAGVTISFEGVSLPARGGEAGNSPAIEGEWRGLLPAKSDDESRSDG